MKTVAIDMDCEDLWFWDAEKDRITFDQVGTQLASKVKNYTEPLDEQLAALGWLDPAQKKQKQTLYTWSVVSILLAILAAVVGITWVGIQAGSGSTMSIATGAMLVGLGVAGFFLASLRSKTIF